jgi:hypothetical protein
VPHDRHLLNAQHTKERNHIHRVDAGVSSPGRVDMKEPRVTEATKRWNDDPIPGIADHRRYLVPRGGIIRPAVKEQHRLGGLRI